MIKITRRLTLGVLLSLPATQILAQPAWPERPVRLIVPFPPGGSNDIVARFLAESLRDKLGQPFLVEHLYRSMPFSPERDLIPVALVAQVPIVLMVPADSPARSLAELIAMARREPGRLTFGSSSIGGTNHLAGELLKSLAAIDIVHVPYRGAAPAMTDLIAGRLQFYFDNMPGVLPQVREGRVRALAVAGAERATALPELPTMAEAGLPGFEASSWFGMAAPSGTPLALISRINAAVLAALAEPALRERLAGAGAEPGKLHAAAFTQFVAAERERWGRVVRASGARAD
jgi:tripartite-type tricarboxylate transporter receptor subunit TctC